MTKNELGIRVSGMDSIRQISPFYQSESRQNLKKGIEWKPFSINSNRIYNDSANIKFEVYEYSKNGQQNLIGEVEYSLINLLNQMGKLFKVMKNGLIVGELKMIDVKRVPRHTFLNYIMTGAQISLMICMDFTNSNMDPRNPESLHYIGDHKKENDYIHALRQVAGILQYFDTDNRIPLYGFGSKLPPYHNVVSHCFALNQNYFDPEVVGLEEAIESTVELFLYSNLSALAYRRMVSELKFHGPSIFSEFVRMAAEIADSEEVTIEK